MFNVFKKAAAKKREKKAAKNLPLPTKEECALPNPPDWPSFWHERCDTPWCTYPNDPEPYRFSKPCGYCDGIVYYDETKQINYRFRLEQELRRVAKKDEERIMGDEIRARPIDERRLLRDSGRSARARRKVLSCRTIATMPIPFPVSPVKAFPMPGARPSHHGPDHDVPEYMRRYRPSLPSERHYKFVQSPPQTEEQSWM
ncbi:hypothetical protein C8J57DRAFT_710960 [Mycena rebaudengoi]|nr:hypothetical protein C8J57DRAFT_710960 [Mycena rebaudengoi]